MLGRVLHLLLLLWRPAGPLVLLLLGMVMLAALVKQKQQQQQTRPAIAGNYKVL
jgi:cytochrome c-type biogenesis protein CcmH/NrfF